MTDHEARPDFESPEVEPTRYFYVHMQKAAGTSLILRLFMLFPEEAIYPNDHDGDIQADAPQGDVPGLLQRWPARKNDIRIIAGHYPLCTASLLDAPFRTFTVLRDPVERTLSYLRHHQVLKEEDRGKSLEELYDDPWVFGLFIHNHMVRMLALKPEELSWGALSYMVYTPERLEQAKANLAAMDMFGLQERMGEFWTEVQDRYSWKLKSMPYFNQTEHVPVSDAFRERIRADNPYDVQLYEFAVALYDERHWAGQ